MATKGHCSAAQVAAPWRVPVACMLPSTPQLHWRAHTEGSFCIEPKDGGKKKCVDEEVRGKKFTYCLSLSAKIKREMESHKYVRPLHIPWHLVLHGRMRTCHDKELARLLQEFCHQQ